MSSYTLDAHDCRSGHRPAHALRHQRRPARGELHHPARRGAGAARARTGPARPPRSRSSRASGCRRPATVSVLGDEPGHRRRGAGGRGSASCCSPGATTARWRVRELLDHLGSFYSAVRHPDRPRPYPTDELIETVGLTEHREQEGVDAVRRATATTGRRDRHRRAPRTAVPGRTDRRLRPGRPAGLPRPGAPTQSDLQDTTILLTTHDLDEAEKLADRILILNGGRIVADGSAEELAHSVAGSAEVRWTQDGNRQVHSTPDADRVRPGTVRPGTGKQRLRRRSPISRCSGRAWRAPT